MTEGQWLRATDPAHMLEFLSGKASDRKLRLFACGVCRELARLAKCDQCSLEVEVGERHADTGKSRAAMERSREALREGRTHLDSLPEEWATFWLCEVALSDNAFRTFGQTVVEHEAIFTSPVRAIASRRVRDVFGNPFRPVAFDPSWLTPAVLSLARQVYESRDFSAMPILADALQDAGCENGDILNHLREPGPHVRGCWALDLVLAKA